MTEFILHCICSHYGLFANAPVGPSYPVLAASFSRALSFSLQRLCLLTHSTSAEWYWVLHHHSKNLNPGRGWPVSHPENVKRMASSRSGAILGLSIPTRRDLDDGGAGSGRRRAAARKHSFRRSLIDQELLIKITWLARREAPRLGPS